MANNFLEIMMSDLSTIEVTAQLEHYYVEKHIIDEHNMNSYHDIFVDTLKNITYYIQFNLDYPVLTEFFFKCGFHPIKDPNKTVLKGWVPMSFTDVNGCVIDIASSVYKGTESDYYVLNEVAFTKNDRYPHSYKICFNPLGLPKKAVFADPKKLMTNVTLKSIEYVIDQETFKLDQICYFIDDKRKHQKCIDGYVAMIIEYPFKKITNKDVDLSDVNIYDVNYFTHTRKELEIIRLSDIISGCEFSYSKMYGRHFTDFLTMSKLFNRRELDIIAMQYI